MRLVRASALALLVRDSGVALELQAQVRYLLRERLHAALDILPALALLARAPGALRAPPPRRVQHTAPAARAATAPGQAAPHSAAGVRQPVTHQGRRHRSVSGAGAVARRGW